MRPETFSLLYARPRVPMIELWELSYLQAEVVLITAARNAG